MHLVEAGKNLIYIRDFLGHESIETTQVYAKANPEARRKALETMDTRMNTPAMPDWNDDPDLKAFLKTLWKIMLRFLVNSLEVTSVLKDSPHNFFLRITSPVP